MKYPILIVDDNPATLAGMQIQFGDVGDISPEFLGTASEAVEAIENFPHRYAAVVLDFHFLDERTNGAEVARQMLAINPKLSIIICSGDSTAAPPIAAVKAQVTDFIPKENPHELFVAVRECFHHFDEAVRIVDEDSLSPAERIGRISTLS